MDTQIHKGDYVKAVFERLGKVGPVAGIVTHYNEKYGTVALDNGWEFSIDEVVEVTHSEGGVA